MVEVFFFDTYAFFEIIEGNPNYQPYLKDIAIITTKLNLMELYYGLLKKFDKIIADKHYDILIKFSIDIDDATIKDAMLFRLANSSKNLSYIDCIGYLISRRNGVKFLTGDKEFSGMENVEFVK